ncbi:MAG: PhnD/SsuA/transferrin family substrate-binding protein [Deltaproteobacteria bacterium]|nr:PhnD/SsuA/transferrin family substrate-binding protein [Deltaproteobacteria bacterium]
MAEITLAVVPSTTPGDSPIALDSLCGALSKLIGSPVRSAHPPTYEALAAGLERDQVQYAWMPPALLVLTEEQIKIRPLLSAVRNERTDYCAALFIDSAGPFEHLAELAGSTVAWVDPMSAAGYLCPRLHLAARGFDPRRFFGRELFLHSHAEVVRAVFDGRASIGATYGERPEEGQPVRRAGFCDIAPDRVARVLEWTPAIPNDMIAGHGLMPTAEHRVFGNAILTLAERESGRQLLYSAFHADRFVTTPRDALRPLRDLVRHARASGLLNQL